MKEWIVKTIVAPFVIDFITNLLTKENMKVYGDKLFDFIEKAVQDSETTWDDTMVLPVVAKIREILDIPDLPDD